jgi:two-component system response regulator RstA
MHPLLMLARISALLRRISHRSPPPAHLLFNGLEINYGLRRASYRGEEIPLTTRKFDMHWHLAQNACTTLDRDRLYRAVFGIEYNGYDRSIDMYIARIRSKMAHYPPLAPMIKTVRGSGYLFATE